MTDPSARCALYAGISRATRAAFQRKKKLAGVGPVKWGHPRQRVLPAPAGGKGPPNDIGGDFRRKTAPMTPAYKPEGGL